MSSYGRNLGVQTSQKCQERQSYGAWVVFSMWRWTEIDVTLEP